MMQFRLKELMKEKGVTYRQLSVDANVSTSTLNKMIQDDPKPVQSDVIERLLEYFNCEPNDLIMIVPGDNVPERELTSASEPVLSTLTPKLLKEHKNGQVLSVLKSWTDQPDELGQEWWDDFERDLEDTRFSLTDLSLEN